MSDQLKLTPLHSRHLAMNAKMAPFAGYDMPISYGTLREEHEAVRSEAGMFDVSHMGEFIVRGKEAKEFIQHVTSNDMSKLKIRQAQYSCFPTPEGGIVDDLLIYRLPEDMCAEGEHAYMLVVNASNIEKDWAWLQKHNTFDTRLINISEQTALLAVQGPKAASALQWLTTTKLSDMQYYTFTKGQFAGVDNVIISATGYTGSGGFELYIPAEKAPEVWDAILGASAVNTEQDEDVQVVPVGLGARDSLRLEMGFALYGNDIDDSTSTLEAGLGWITKLDKEDFVGKQFLVDQKAAGIKRRLVGIRVDDRRVARHGYPIVDEHDREIGVITSGSQSPSLGYPIAMGYVPFKMRKPGTQVRISTGKKILVGEVVRVPFARAQS
jgi:aminomethyltransferase